MITKRKRRAYPPGVRLLLLSAFAFALASCQSQAQDENGSVLLAGLGGSGSGGTSSSAPGSAGIFMSSAQMDAANVTRVTVTVTAADIVSPVTFNLSKTGNEWGGIVNNIPSGGGRTFSAEAFDAADTLMFTGQATGITVATASTVQVYILMQEAQAPTPFENHSPNIDSVSVSAGSVAPSGTIAMVAQASDPNPGDTLVFAWTANGGSFDAPANASTNWTAPAGTGNYTVTVTATDNHSAIGSLSFAITVTNDPGQGSGEFTIEFNTAPVISGIVANPSRIDLNEQSNLTVNATDNEDASLTYAWTNDCGGSFSDASLQSPVFFAPAVYPAGNECVLTVQVSDGRGGVQTGNLTIYVASAILPNFAPQISTTYQNATTALVNESFTLRVGATDPEGDTMSFGWSSSGGTLGTQSDTASTTENTFTAASAGTYDITVTVGDGGPIATTYVFQLTVNNPGPPPFNGTVQDGTSTYDRVSDLASDSSGNLFAVGTTSGTWDGNTPFGSSDAFVAKYDAGGARQWVRFIGTAQFDNAEAVATDPTDGSVYVAGTAGDSITANPGDLGGYIRKFDSAGNVLWTIQQVSGVDVIWNDLIVDASGDLYATGSTFSDFAATNAGQYDFVLAKYSSAGVQQWARQVGGTNVDHGRALALDAAGNVFAAVEASSYGPFDGLSPLGGTDIVVLKYDPNGVKQWRIITGTSGEDYARAIAIDSVGSIYVAGYSNVNFPGQGAGNNGAALWKHNSIGTFVWHRREGALQYQIANSMAIAADDSIYMFGYTQGSVDGQPHAGSGDGLLLKYDSAGSRIFTRQLGTSADDRGEGIVVNAQGVYVSGYTGGGLDGNVSLGNDDIFLARYTTAGVLE